MRISPKKDKDYPWYIRLMFWLQKRKHGKVVMPLKIWGRSPLSLVGFALFFGALDRKSSPLTLELRSLVNVKVAKINRCPFCIKINSDRVKAKEKLTALEAYRESELLSDQEKVAVEYAEAITRSDLEVSDALFTRLKEHFSEDEIVELTGMIAFENCSSKFNKALDL